MGISVSRSLEACFGFRGDGARVRCEISRPNLSFLGALPPLFRLEPVSSPSRVRDLDLDRVLYRCGRAYGFSSSRLGRRGILITRGCCFQDKTKNLKMIEMSDKHAQQLETLNKRQLEMYFFIDLSIKNL